jgi:hypothetical protein
MGHFTSKRMSLDTLKKWKGNFVSKLIGYEPKSLILAKGWMAWIMRISL